jgi:hypothetical protein
LLWDGTEADEPADGPCNQNEKYSGKRRHQALRNHSHYQGGTQLEMRTMAPQQQRFGGLHRNEAADLEGNQACRNMLEKLTIGDRTRFRRPQPLQGDLQENRN